MSAGDGVLFVERVLGQGRFADAHRSDRHGATCPTQPYARHLPPLRASSTGRGQSDVARKLSAVPQSARFGAGPARAVGRARRVVDPGHCAAASRVPRLADGTLVPPLPQSSVGFPTIPGVTYTGLQTTRYRFNYGPRTVRRDRRSDDQSARGQLRRTRTTRPTARSIPSYVPTSDSTATRSQGSGCPNVTVPLATYTGWALACRRLGQRRLRRLGQYIPVRERPRRIASPPAIRARRSRSATSRSVNIAAPSSMRSTTSSRIA